MKGLKKGTSRETSAVRHRQCRLYTQGHFSWRESFGGRRYHCQGRRLRLGRNT